MRYKATFAAGFAAGFLAGSRAGRGAYDKIVSAGQRVASHPKVQEATSAAQAKATDLAKTAASKAPDAAKNAARTAQAQASQVPKYVSTAKQAAQSKLPARLGGTSDETATGSDDVAPDGTLVYPVDGSVNGTHYSPDTP
jgi:septal ring factor EnvC (AmiA/AmiB activator)